MDVTVQTLQAQLSSTQSQVTQVTNYKIITNTYHLPNLISGFNLDADIYK